MIRINKILFSIIFTYCFSCTDAPPVLIQAITVDEQKSGTVDGGTSLTISSVTGGTDKTFVLGIGNKGNDAISSVTGGALTWTSRMIYCVDNGSVLGAIYTATGTASSFDITVTFSTTTTGNATVGVFDGDDGSFSDILGNNDCDGEVTANPSTCGTTCAKNTPASITVGNGSAAGDVKVVFVSYRNRTINSEPSGWDNKVNSSAGSGGDQNQLVMYTETGTAGDQTATIGFSSTDDWVAVALYLTESGGGGGTEFHPGRKPRVF